MRVMRALLIKVSVDLLFYLGRYRDGVIAGVYLRKCEFVWCGGRVSEEKDVIANLLNGQNSSHYDMKIPNFSPLPRFCSVQQKSNQLIHKTKEKV